MKKEVEEKRQENQFLIDSDRLSEKALARKHQLESDPSCRKDPLAYFPDMEQIDSKVRSEVIRQMESYDYERYTASDVRRALEHQTCSVDDFKALNPAANRSLIIASVTPHILLPYDSVSVFKQNLNAMGDRRLASWTVWVP